jgi:hypothetical protein
MVRLTQTGHLSCVSIGTIWKRTEVSLKPYHLGVQSVVSKMISEQLVHLAQTMHRSCTDSNTVSKEKEVRFHMTHVTKEFHRVCPKWFLCLWYTRRKPCTDPASRLALSLKGPKRDCTWASHLVVPSSASKKISEPVVHLAQTMHLSCTNTNIFSKRKEERFHMIHVT